jgi:hypothetical protein
MKPPTHPGVPMKASPLFSIGLALALLSLNPAHAQDDDGPPPDHPKYEEFCKQNPTTCEVGKERREAQKKWCENNPEKCQKLKDERKARHEKMREKCDADPEKCAKKKEDFRERMRERRERRQDNAPNP